MLGWCRSCKHNGRFGLRLSVKRRHHGTAYVNPEQNESRECEHCHELTVAYWQDAWNEYYAGVR